ncbi:hypothetical protein G6F68_014570 [Rhizopus microsporus]|nr:hypothetical protein G6F68_014570 [Rhizopus microsporus]
MPTVPASVNRMISPSVREDIVTGLVSGLVMSRPLFNPVRLIWFASLKIERGVNMGPVSPRVDKTRMFRVSPDGAIAVLAPASGDAMRSPGPSNWH